VRWSLLGGSTRTESRPGRERVGGATGASGLSGATEEGTGLGLQDRDEVDRLHVGVVLSALLVGEFALVALAGQLVDASLGLGIEPIVDQFTGHVGRQDFTEWVEQTVQNGCIERLHGGILPRIVKREYHRSPLCGWSALGFLRAARFARQVGKRHCS